MGVNAVFVGFSSSSSSNKSVPHRSAMVFCNGVSKSLVTSLCETHIRVQCGASNHQEDANGILLATNTQTHVIAYQLNDSRERERMQEATATLPYHRGDWVLKEVDGQERLYGSLRWYSTIQYNPIHQSPNKSLLRAILLLLFSNTLTWPAMLFVSGEVSLICKKTTMLMAKPKKPAKTLRYHTLES